MWILQRAHSPADGPTLRLGPGTARTVGRARQADFSIDVPLLSRRHCRLTVSPVGQLEVADLDSTNGTFVNGRRVRRATLVAGDRLRVGRLELTVAFMPDPLPQGDSQGRRTQRRAPGSAPSLSES